MTNIFEHQDIDDKNIEYQDIYDKNIEYQDVEVTLMTKILNTDVDDRERATLDLQKPYSLQQGNS